MHVLGNGDIHMKKVALFSDGWKRLITYAWVDGMMKFISKVMRKSACTSTIAMGIGA